MAQEGLPKMRTLMVLAVAATLAGCVSTNSTLLGAPQTLSAIAPGSVTFYRTPDQVLRPYSEVALLHASGDSLWTSEKAMFESMRKEAAKLGADAIILEPVQEPSTALKVAAAVLHVSAPRKGRALAIRTLPPK
ncbi:hypothetical protein DBR21_15450 [Caulobacter sp. HMWF009]|nr:hypothetical protein DBR21_15450 [Caulobacter sp. HMWF009]PTT05697.1 hypothetical protein DBR10_14825 [Caulobacter sp. HMWF025]